MGFLARQLDRFLFSHWRWIDREYMVPAVARQTDVPPTVPPTVAPAIDPISENRIGPEARAIITVVTVSLVLVFMQYIVLSRGGIQRAMALELPALLNAFDADLGAWLQKYSRLIENLTWALGCSFFYFVVPGIVARVVFRERLRDHGLTARGFVRHLWIYALLFVPVGLLVWIVSYSDAFQSRYPFYANPHALADFLVWEAAYALQFFSLEFFFRGFMLNGLRDKLGHHAIFVMVIPYMMIHFQKPFLETVGAIIAGTVLGTLALRTRTIWGGVAIHVAVAVSMDVAALFQKGWSPPA